MSVIHSEGLKLLLDVVLKLTIAVLLLLFGLSIKDGSLTRVSGSPPNTAGAPAQTGPQAK
jgi:hypothetical protein